MIRKQGKKVLSCLLMLCMLGTTGGTEVFASTEGQTLPEAVQGNTTENQEVQEDTDGTEDTKEDTDTSDAQETPTVVEGDSDYADTINSLFSEDLPVEEVEEVAENLESDYSKVGQSSVSALLEEYKEFRNQVYVNQIPEKPEGISSEIYGFESTRASQIAALAKESNLAFTKADTSFQVQNQSESGDQITLTVYEWVFLTYNNGADICGYGFDHVMTVTQKDGVYMLEADAYADGSLAYQASPSSTTEQKEQAGLILGDTSALEENAGSGEENVGTTYATSNGYSADKAVAYADSYATSYNSSYSNYNSVGGDCANFVSQCLAAGGLKQTSGWYYNSYSDVSSSWIYCPTQVTYMATLGTRVNNPSDSQVLKGNPVWYYKSGTYAHAAFCVGTNSSGTPVVDAHNTDRYRVVWNLGGSASGWTGYATVQLESQTHDPIGWFDEAKGGAGSVYVRGWAFDPDSPTTPLKLLVYVGGDASSGVPAYEITADKSRPDVGNAYAGVGDNHGYEATINVSKTGSQKIYIYGVNVGSGSNILIDTKTVTISSAVNATGVTLNTTSLALNGVGATEKLTATVTPSNVTNSSVTWSSSNTSVATINDAGTVTATGTGTAVLTAMTQDGNKMAHCIVTVESTGANHTHTYTLTKADNPTCTTGGTVSFQCSECNTSYTENLSALGHSFGDWTITKEATYDAAGTQERVCSICGEKETQVIPQRDKTSLENATISGIVSKEYTGKALTQSDLTVKVGTSTLSLGDDYTVAYSNNKNLGTATMVITGKGAYSGLVEKTFKVVVVKGSTYTVDSMKYKMVYTTQTGAGTVTLTGTTKSKSKLTSLTVGNTVTIGGKSYKITAIKSDAFKSYKYLKKVVIGNNVKIIGSSAFSGCTGMTGITLGTGLEQIGYAAFYNCTALSGITIKSRKLSTVSKNAILHIKKKAVINVYANKVATYKKKFTYTTGFRSTMKIK